MLAEAISSALDSGLKQNIFNLKNRASRFEYLCVTLVNTLVTLILVYSFFYLSFPLYDNNGTDFSLITIIILGLIAFPFSFAQFIITIRRMHDINFPSFLSFVSLGPYFCLLFIGLNYYTSSFYIPHSLVSMTIAIFVWISSFVVVQIILTIVPSAPANAFGNFPEPIFPQDFVDINKFQDFSNNTNNTIALFKILQQQEQTQLLKENCSSQELVSHSIKLNQLSSQDSAFKETVKTELAQERSCKNENILDFDDMLQEFSNYCSKPTPPDNYYDFYHKVCKKNNEIKASIELQNQFALMWDKINTENQQNSLKELLLSHRMLAKANKSDLQSFQTNAKPNNNLD